MTQVSFSRGQLKCDGTCAETRFRLLAERTSPFKSAGASLRSTTGSWGVRISGSNAGYAVFWGSVKGTGYPLHSPVSPSLPLPCVTVCHHFSTGVCNQEYPHYGPAVRTPSSIIRFAVLQNDWILNILSEHLALGRSIPADSILVVLLVLLQT